MTHSKLEDNSLLLVKVDDPDEILYSSKHPGLRPLLKCIIDNHSILNSGECILYDKVIGLAAARLIVFSGFIVEVRTPLASDEAVKLLELSGIQIHAATIVPNILNKDKSAVCPMEQKAMKIEDNSEFYEHLRTIMMM